MKPLLIIAITLLATQSLAMDNIIDDIPDYGLTAHIAGHDQIEIYNETANTYQYRDKLSSDPMENPIDVNMYDGSSNSTSTDYYDPATGTYRTITIDNN